VDNLHRSRGALVIARSDNDEAIQSGLFAFASRPWIASLALAMTQAIPFSRCAFFRAPSIEHAISKSLTAFPTFVR